MTELISKLRIDINEAQESLYLLTALRKRLRGSDPAASVEAVGLGLLKFAFACAQSSPADDQVRKGRNGMEGRREGRKE